MVIYNIPISSKLAELSTPIMLASPPAPTSFSSLVCWPFQDTYHHGHNNSNHVYTQINEASESLVHCPDPSRPNGELRRSTPSMSISSDPTTVQKLCHNARERHRRKRINHLYTTLRSLLPAADQMVPYIFLLFCLHAFFFWFSCEFPRKLIKGRIATMTHSKRFWEKQMLN
jgi:hypothetical protein